MMDQFSFKQVAKRNVFVVKTAHMLWSVTFPISISVHVQSSLKYPQAQSIESAWSAAMTMCSIYFTIHYFPPVIFAAPDSGDSLYHYTFSCCIRCLFACLSYFFNCMDELVQVAAKNIDIVVFRL